MKKIIIFLIVGLILGFSHSSGVMASETFIAKVRQVGLDDGNAYDGTAYYEVYFTDVQDGVVPAYSIYAIPVASEPSFTYLFTKLEYAATRNQYVRIFSNRTWTRHFSDGTDSNVYGRIDRVDKIP